MRYDFFAPSRLRLGWYGGGCLYGNCGRAAAVAAVVLCAVLKQSLHTSLSTACYSLPLGTLPKIFFFGAVLHIDGVARAADGAVRPFNLWQLRQRRVLLSITQIEPPYNGTQPPACYLPFWSLYRNIGLDVLLRHSLDGTADGLAGLSLYIAIAAAGVLCATTHY